MQRHTQLRSHLAHADRDWSGVATRSWETQDSPQGVCPLHPHPQTQTHGPWL